MEAAQEVEKGWEKKRKGRREWRREEGEGLGFGWPQGEALCRRRGGRRGGGAADVGHGTRSRSVRETRKTTRIEGVRWAWAGRKREGPGRKRWAPAGLGLLPFRNFRIFPN